MAELTVAFPCQKYKFDFGEKCSQGSLLISWSYNTGFNRCGDFYNEDIKVKQFVIKIVDMFDNVLVEETIQGNKYYLAISKEEPRFFYVSEPGGKEQFEILLFERNSFPKFSSMDSVSYHLLSGNFYNAQYLMDKMGIPLQDTIKKLHKDLFPEFYPDTKNFFNHYYNSQTNELIKMPYISGVDIFLNEIGKALKGSNKQGTVWVWAQISANNELIDYEVLPEENKISIENSIHKLKFDNQSGHSSYVLLIVTIDKRRLLLFNRRALTNPSSPTFKSKFRYWGPVH